MANFSYLLDHCRGNSEDLQDFKFMLELNVDAEKWIHRRISTSMMILRQSNEEFIKFLAKKNHIDLYSQLPNGKTSARTTMELIDELMKKESISPYMKDRLHTIRQVGNEATHNARYDDVKQAQLQFQNAYELLQAYFQLYFAPKHFRSKNYEWLEPPSQTPPKNNNSPADNNTKKRHQSQKQHATR